MKSDILERLREELELNLQCELDDPLLKDAAAEIERLRTSVADFKAATEAAHRATDNRNAEIERLHADLESADRVANAWGRQAAELRQLLRFFFENVPVQYHERYADAMKRAAELLNNE